ncbi:hypothetical protein SEHO0A_04469 [Salmonella enterica subsp. houtenae str. ATCC BAA-1581]|nr:hypothetical protein SEHO0A_04469 [Salmonella enterica subsp. houtenae str. ATCC BAA-1581]ENZ84225.1 hypothetical protein D088_900026 [Salmonella enterica subsp. houtenae serovar 16:z4,z32:-- str. RKS3027]
MKPFASEPDATIIFFRKNHPYSDGFFLSLAGNIKSKTYPVISFIYKK